MRCRSAAICLLLVACLFSPTQADENPGEWFSDEAVVVVRVRQPKTTLAKAVATAYRISPVFVELLVGSDSNLQELSAELGLQSIDLDRDIWWGGFFDENGELAYYAVLQTTDEAALLAALKAKENGLAVLHQGSTLIVASSQTAIGPIQRQIAGQGASFAGAMSAEQRAVFDAGDISALVNTRQIYARMRRELPPGEQDPDDTKWSEPLVQWVRDEGFGRLLRPETAAIGLNAFIDASNVVVGGSIDNSGIEIEVISQHDHEAPTAIKPDCALSNFQVLQRMPPGRQCYVLGTAPFPSPAGWFLEILELDDHNDAEDAPRLTEQEQFVRRLAKLNYGQWSAAFSFPTATSRELRLDAVAEIDKPQAFRLMNNNLAVTQSHFKDFREKRAYERLDSGERYGDHVADVHRVTYKKVEGNNVDYEARLNGLGGLESRCLYDDKMFVNTIGGGKPAMELALRRLRAENLPELPAGLAATRSKLPAEGSFLLLVDAASVITSLIRLENDAMNDLGVLTDIVRNGAAMAASPSYFGLSIALRPEQARMKLYLPTAQISTFIQAWMMGGGDLF